MGERWEWPCTPAAVEISDEARRRWLEDGFAAIRRGEDYFYVTSGNSVVVVVRMESDEGGVEMRWFDCVLRSQGGEPA